MKIVVLKFGGTSVGSIDRIKKVADIIIKYNKTIFRVGNLNKEGCRVWEQGGKKYMCFWDTVLERYTTCINPMISWKKERN